MSNIITRSQTPADQSGSAGTLGSTLSNAQLDNNFYAIDVTEGTVAAKKAVVVDANKDFTGLRNGTATGTLTAATVNATSALQINGTSVLSVIPYWTLLESIDASAGTETALENTSVPSGTLHIKVVFNGVSTNGTSKMTLTLGDATNYSSSSNSFCYAVSSALAHAGATVDTTGVSTLTASQLATYVYSGTVDLTLSDTTDWILASQIFSTGSTIYQHQTAGVITLPTSEATRIKVSTLGGSDVFDAGSVDIYVCS